jgi:hypothetical protein
MEKHERDHYDTRDYFRENPHLCAQLQKWQKNARSARPESQVSVYNAEISYSQHAPRRPFDGGGQTFLWEVTERCKGVSDYVERVVTPSFLSRFRL